MPRKLIVPVWILAILVLIFCATLFLSAKEPAYFAPYFGGLTPSLTVLAVGVLGLLGFSGLQRQTKLHAGLSGLRTPTFGRIIMLAVLFSIPAIMMDLILRFPMGINIPAPDSLVFYPVMAVVAEILFHILPLYALQTLSLTGKQGDRLSGSNIFYSAALIEPVFQSWYALGGGGPGLLDALVFLHVLVFNLCQLHLFRRFGFAAMLLLRLVYYLLWHIVWGHIRLPLLY